MLVWPFVTAMCKGGWPLSVLAWISAPAETRAKAVSVWPFSAALCKGVIPVNDHRVDIGASGDES